MYMYFSSPLLKYHYLFESINAMIHSDVYFVYIGIAACQICVQMKRWTFLITEN